MTPEPEKRPPAPATAPQAPQPAPASFEKPDLGPTTKEEILAYVEGKIKAPPHLPQIEGDTLANKANRVLVVHCNYRELYFQHGDAEVTKLAKEKLKALFTLATEGVLQAARNRTAAIQERAPQAFAMEETAKLKEETKINITPTGMMEVVKPGDTVKFLDNGRIYKINDEDRVKCEITRQAEPKGPYTGFVNASAFDKAPTAKPLTTEEEAAAAKPAAGAEAVNSGKVLEFNESNFDAEVLRSDKPVIVDFYAPWCSPCKTMEPIMATLAKRHAGNVKIGRLNTEENQKLAEQYKIKTIPCLLVFKNGQVVNRMEGAYPEVFVEQTLIYNNPAPATGLPQGSGAGLDLPKIANYKNLLARLYEKTGITIEEKEGKILIKFKDGTTGEIMESADKNKLTIKLSGKIGVLNLTIEANQPDKLFTLKMSKEGAGDICEVSIGNKDLKISGTIYTKTGEKITTTDQAEFDKLLKEHYPELETFFKNLLPKKPASTATPSPTQPPVAPETPPPKLNIKDNPELAKFDFTPDVIIAFGYNHKNGNTKRAHSALQVFVNKNHRATLIATGTSKEFQDANDGLSQAKAMYQVWQEAGYPQTDLDAKLASGQIVLEETAARSLDNIKKTFKNIIDQAKKNPSQPVKVCLVSDKLDHCEELVKFLKAEWKKYNNQTDHPKINLQVGCFYGSGSFVLEPWLAEGTAAPTPTKTEEPAAAPAPETRRGPKKSTESNLYNEWELKFPSGQKIYCGGSLGRDDSNPNSNHKPELAETQIKNKGIRYIISLHHLEHVKSIVDKLNAPPENLGITLTTKIYRVGATESHFNQNKSLWEEIGRLINKGESFLIHCLNGTHRGPSALTGGFIASGKVKSLGEAMKLSGLEMRNCTQYSGLIWQLIRFAREKGLTVEEEYIKFYNENRKADQPEIPVSTPVPTTTPASPTRPPAANPKPAPANLAPTSPQPPVKPAETPDAQISEILTALNFENIAGLDLNRLDEYFQTLKKAVNADKLKIEKIIETIFPKEREKTIAIIYSNRYRQKMVTAIADNNRKNPQSGAYFQKWQKLIAAVNTTGKHRLNHLKVWQKFLEIFSTDLNKNKRSFVLKNPQATNIDPTKDLSNSHKEALDVFFKGNFIGKEGAFETGPEITAYEGGIVIAAAGDFKYTGTGQETPDSTEAKAAYAGGGFSTPLSGNGLAILTYSGEVHYYSHMHSVSIKQGQIVQAGDVLGRGGNTGTNAINGKGKHLHLQMHTINYSANLITEHPPEFIRTRLLEAQ